MLKSLSIKNFTTIEALFLELEAGLLAVTGETGAGKSVMLDAISLALGERLQGLPLRNESKAAEICCGFLLSGDNRELEQWLQDGGFERDADEELLLRRVINPDGRSRAFINDSPVNLSRLRELAPLLVEQHSQHAHYSLLDRKQHSALLDDFGALDKLATEVRELAREHNGLGQRIATLHSELEQQRATGELLRYQLEELDALAIENGEVSALEQEYRRLGSATELNSAVQQAMAECSGDGDGSALAALQRSLQALQAQQAGLTELGAPIALIESALIQLDEAGGQLEALGNSLEPDPAREQQIEQRLDQLYSIARKHQVKADELDALQENLQSQLAALAGAADDIDALCEQQRLLAERYQETAAKLSKKRIQTAKKLTKAVNQKLASLAMKHCEFAVSIEPRENEPHDSEPCDNETRSNEQRAKASNKLSEQGLETVELLIATVPGKPPQSLGAVASGGELSRISLAIRVVISKTKGAGTLIFDEVDVGIGGGVAEVVGVLIRELAEDRQVICVTHLAQVAAKATHHYLVEKQVGKKQVSTSLQQLDPAARKAELARMVSGLDVTEASLAQADELMAAT